jgi:hypothetical protein
VLAAAATAAPNRRAPGPVSTSAATARPPRRPARRGPRRQHPGVLRAAALTGIDHPRALDQGHPRQAAREHPHLIAVVDRERSQVDVARSQRAFDLRRHRREFHHRLRNPASRIVADLPGGGGQVFRGSVRAEHDAVTTGPLDRFEHQFVNPVEDFFAFVVQPAPVCLNVGQQRFLAQVVLDHGRHIGVDELVVAHTVADRAGDDDVAGAGGVDQTGHPQHRVGAELQRIQERVVDAPIDDVDLALTLGGAHVHLVVSTKQVAAFHELDAHLTGQQRMLEIRRVRHPWSKDDDGGIGLVGGRGVAQRAQQVRRVVVDGAHPVGGEQVRENPRHGAPVLHHIRHTRGRAQVVLENPEIAPFIADQVDAGHVDPHPVGRDDAEGLTVKMLAGSDQAARDDVVVQDFLIAVDVVEIQLEGLDPLGDAALQPAPLGGRDHAWHQVERERPLLTRQRKRDALVDERAAQRVGAGLQLGSVGGRELGVDALVRTADGALGVEHLIEGHRIGVRRVVSAEDALGARVRTPGSAARSPPGFLRPARKTHFRDGASHRR